MVGVFLKLLNMSISASWLVLVVVLARLVLKKAPKAVAVIMWALVALRLVCPFLPQSEISLIPSSETVPENISVSSEPQIHSGIPTLNSTVNPVIEELSSYDGGQGFRSAISAASSIWLAGVALMLVYAAVSYIRIHRRVRESIPTEDGVRLCDRVETPFILGVFLPRVYLPSDTAETDREYVIAHERAHLKRLDHIWKPLGYLLLSIYWFNPAMWVAYILLCRDIELACDEKVIKSMGAEIKKPYSEALINCSVSRKTLSACPLAFGEVGVKKRIKSVLNYKKPAFWIIVAAVVACALLTVFFLTDPLSEIDAELSIAIREQITEHNKSSRPESKFYAQCFEYDLLGIEESGDETTAYMWVMYREYSSPDTIEQGSNIPTAITFRNENGEYSLVEYWTPRDGSRYAEDIKSKFPARLRRKVFNTGYSSSHLCASCENQARQFFAFLSAITDAAREEVPEAKIDTFLREKYPEYFGLNTEKGLSVYVWPTTGNNEYNFALFPDKDASYGAVDTIRFDAASLAEMRAILSTYDISRDQINYYIVGNPLSSYFFVPNESYVPLIEKMLWEGCPDDSCYDEHEYDDSQTIAKMSFDIDGDGIEEDCTVIDGPTSGIYTYRFSASQNGVLEYSDVFVLEAYDLRFVREDDGRVTLHGNANGEEKVIEISVDDGYIVLISDGEKVFHWG